MWSCNQDIFGGANSLGYIITIFQSRRRSIDEFMIRICAAQQKSLTGMTETIRIGDLKPQLAIIPYRVKVDESELDRLARALRDRWNSLILTNPSTGALRKDVADVRVIETWSEGHWHATAAYYAVERPPQWLKRAEKAWSFLPKNLHLCPDSKVYIVMPIPTPFPFTFSAYLTCPSYLIYPSAKSA